MSLQGTLRTLGITEVLEFLAGRSATGRLDINADSGSAVYWMLRGEVAGVDYDFERESGVDAAEATYYALSELDGSFFFDEGEAPEHGTPTEAVADVLGRTADIAEGWSIVEEVIPTQRHQLSRSNVLDGSVTIEPAWWQAIEAISGGCSARELADLLDMRTLAASTMASEMARKGLVVVGEPIEVVEAPAAPAEPVAVIEPEPEPIVEPEPLVDEAPLSAPPVETPEPVIETPDVLSTESPEPEPAPVDAPPVFEAAPEPVAEPSADPSPVQWGEPAPVPEAAPVASEPVSTWAEPTAPIAEEAPVEWNTPAAEAPAHAAVPDWGQPADAAPAPVAAVDDDGWSSHAPTTATAPATPEADDGWGNDHAAAAGADPQLNDAAAALASWGAVAAQAPPAPTPAAAPAPAPAPGPDPFADLPSASDLAAQVAAPAPAPVPPAPVPEADPQYQTPTQAAVFAAAPPTPSPYAPDHAPVEPAPIAPPVGTPEQVAALDDLADDFDDEDFGTDDRSSVLKFLRRD